eukprot:m.269984 g.269984  ORF g.269984 m.269984 type:complete len:132 (+) comp15676_c1_seq10:203-598(+)
MSGPMVEISKDGRFCSQEATDWVMTPFVQEHLLLPSSTHQQEGNVLTLFDLKDVRSYCTTISNLLKDYEATEHRKPLLHEAQNICIRLRDVKAWLASEWLMCDAEKMAHRSLIVEKVILMYCEFYLWLVCH